MSRINPNINNASGFNNSNLQTHARNVLTLTPDLQGKRGVQYLNGFLFNSGNGNVLFNSGTDNSGGYVPPFSVRGGKISVEGLKDFNTARKPENSNEHFENSVNELKLTQNADGSFSRKGFVGTYTRAENGGIIFSGGHHASNPNIKFEPQIYLNGQWFRLGANNGTNPSSAGFGGSLSRSSGVDKFSSTASTSLSFDFSSISSGDTFSSESVGESTTKKTAKKSQPNIQRTSEKRNQNVNPKKVEVRWTSDGNNLTDGLNLFKTHRVNGRVSWYEVMDRDLLTPYKLSSESRGRLHYLVPDDNV